MLNEDIYNWGDRNVLEIIWFYYFLFIFIEV